MTPTGWLAESFEQNRRHLHRVAYRILGSTDEANDALQETWIRASRTDPGSVDNLQAWLTTTVARVCLDMLRARRARQRAADEPPQPTPEAANPEAELQLADSVGPALLVVLETLDPAERVAFVLHDMFDVSFAEIGGIVGRSEEAARQLASRARRRIQGDQTAPKADLGRHREIVHAFLAAARDGDFDALLAVLDPDAVLHADSLSVETAAATKWGGTSELQKQARGAAAVAAMLNKRGTGVRPALIDGRPGAAWIHDGRAQGIWRLDIVEGRIKAVELMMDPATLARLVVEPAP